METKIKSLDDKIEAINNKIEAINDKIESLDDKIEVIDKTICLDGFSESTATKSTSNSSDQPPNKR